MTTVMMKITMVLKVMKFMMVVIITDYCVVIMTIVMMKVMTVLKVMKFIMVNFVMVMIAVMVFYLSVSFTVPLSSGAPCKAF